MGGAKAFRLAHCRAVSATGGSRRLQSVGDCRVDDGNQREADREWRSAVIPSRPRNRSINRGDVCGFDKSLLRSLARAGRTKTDATGRRD